MLGYNVYFVDKVEIDGIVRLSASAGEIIKCAFAGIPVIVRARDIDYGVDVNLFQPPFDFSQLFSIVSGVQWGIDETDPDHIIIHVTNLLGGAPPELGYDIFTADTLQDFPGIY